MEDEELLVSVKDRLNKMNTDYDELDATIQKNLLKIECEIKRRFEEQQKSIQILKSNRINVNTIAKSGIISNKTVYKYPLLLEYIKNCESLYNALIPGNHENEDEIKQQLKNVTNKLRMLDEKTVDIELLKAENDRLNEDIQGDEIKIKGLIDTNIKLEEELKSIKKNHPEIFESNKAQIIIMPGSTQK